MRKRLAATEHTFVDTTREDDGRRATCSPRHLLVKDNERTMIKLVPDVTDRWFHLLQGAMVLSCRSVATEAGCVNGYSDQVSVPIQAVRFADLSVRRESEARLYQTQCLKEIAACPRPTFRSFDYVKWRGTKVFRV